LTEKGLSVTLSCVILTGAELLFVRETVLVAELPTGTVPKATVLVAMLNEPADPEIP
jgi:hypothetical protein